MELLDPNQPAVLGVTFAGIDFALEGATTLLEQVRAVPLVTLRPPVGPSLGRDSTEAGSVFVRVREASDGELQLRCETVGARGVQWECDDDRGRAVTQHAYIEWRVVRSRFYADARVDRSSRSSEGLLTALAAAVLHSTGGAVLHAASVELPYGVVAFIGPSGSGKSTACQHVTGARLFSVDRLAVAPAQPSARRGHRWCAAPLPGGTGSLPNLKLGSGSGRAALALVARVHQASTETRLAECSHSEAVAALRACAFHAGSGARVELELLRHLEHLAEEVPFANLHLRFGDPLEPALRDWLNRRPAGWMGSDDSREMQASQPVPE